ncbi:uncharacterized protein TNCV_1563131 [Trichonephila clavipes]|nr:uncharacterized protein TNCV_1563131 [Trichonephila clavipes]
MPGKRARRHLSQLRSLRGLIIGMKTADWSTRRVAGTHARKTGSGATRTTTRREDRKIMRQALVDPTVTRSTIPTGVDVAIVLKTISRHFAEANIKSSALSVHSP